MKTYKYNCKYGFRLVTGKCPPKKLKPSQIENEMDTMTPQKSKKSCKNGVRLLSGKCPKKTCKFGNRLKSGKCPPKNENVMGSLSLALKKTSPKTIPPLLLNELVDDKSSDNDKSPPSLLLDESPPPPQMLTPQNNKDKNPKYNKMNLSVRVEKIVNKIIKNNNIKRNIQQTIVNDTTHSTKTFLYLSNLINRQKQTKNDVENRTFVSNKLSHYIRKNHYTEDMKIADIGGGNGQILKELGQSLSLPQTNLYCVEQITPWAEPYAYNNSQFIQYIFWDNKTIPTIEPKSLDVVFVMVTLHHMTDETIHNTMINLIKLVKKGSLLIIKEHDCKSAEDKYVIDWEHHLYHLVETPTQTEHDIQQYKKHYIDNFKTKARFDDIIEHYGYQSVQELNRFFEETPEPNNKNPTNLYWKIYQKV
jgi:SAM-dependent methyltransferase